jgi:signal transduction histidine kinase
MAYVSKALISAKELSLNTEQKDLLFSKGLILKSQNRTLEARDTFLEAIAIARNSGDSLYVAKMKTELVILDQSSQLEKEKEHTLIENINISTEKGDLINAAEGHNKLAEWYAARKQFDKAYANLRQAHQMNDSLRGNEIILQLKKLEEEYQSEKKEKEIALLKKDQELQVLTLSKQKAFTTSIVTALIGVVLTGLLLINRYRIVNRAKRQAEIERVRNHIARDLHDDIGSTLSSINILSQVALSEKNGSVSNYLQRIGEQSSRMMEDIGDIVWSINPNNDSTDKLIVRMREFATEILEPKNISYHFTEAISNKWVMDAEKRKNLFLIFKESINNAAKYSHASKLEISLHQEDHTLVMQVKDNGLGFDEHAVNPGNGLRNLNERAKQINGTVSVKSKVLEGTMVELRIPLA